MKIKENKTSKHIRSQYYNYNFDKVTGYFERWGQTKEDDPAFAPGPEILDLEISSGKCKGNCTFCYKSNGVGSSYNMTFEEFRTIFHKLGPFITQIAFGITDIDANPDFFKMAEYSREHGVIPNFTMHGLDDITPERVADIKRIFGACAISIYDQNKSFNWIKALTDAGMDQINIHYMVAEETYDSAFKLADDIKSDIRTEKLNALVFLQCKEKGAAEGSFHSISHPDKYKKLVEYMIEKEVNFGFDSCSAPLFLKSIEGVKNEKVYTQLAEPCESGIFSSYINDKGVYFPCSFAEDIVAGIDVLGCNDFIADVWNHKQTKEWREKLINSSKGCNCKFSNGLCRSCPIYEELNSCKRIVNG